VTTETELKFAVDVGAAVALESALRKRGATLRTIRSRYFDTEDARLAEAHLSLRLRKAGGVWEQTLKAPGPSAIEREEESVPRPGKWGTAGRKWIPRCTRRRVPAKRSTQRCAGRSARPARCCRSTRA